MSNKNLLRLIICSGIILCSCKSWVSKKYGFNRPFNYAGKHDFLAKLHQRNIDSNCIYVTNPTGLNPLIYWLGTNNPPLYIGLFMNDSVMLKRSDFLKDNQSCMGRLENEISQNLEQIRSNTAVPFDTLAILNSIPMYQLSSGKRRNSLISGKPTLFMYYLDGRGTYYDDLFKEVDRIYQQQKGTVDLVILCCDYQTTRWLPKP